MCVLAYVLLFHGDDFVECTDVICNSDILLALAKYITLIAGIFTLPLVSVVVSVVSKMKWWQKLLFSILGILPLVLYFVNILKIILYGY